MLNSAGSRRAAVSLAVAFALVIGAVLAGVYVRFGVYPNLVPKNFGIVEDGKLYRAGELTPAALEQLHERYRFRTIIDLGAEQHNSPEDIRAQRTADALGVTRYRFNLEGDSTGNPNYYLHFLRLATDPANHPVLVHCAAGAQRTSCAVLLYQDIIQNKGRTEHTYNVAREHGQDPGENPRVLLMLWEWSDRIRQAYLDGSTVAGAHALPAPAPEPRALSR